MEQTNIARAYSEVDAILEKMDKANVEKIPIKLRKMFKEEKSDGGGTMSSASYVEETIPQGVNKLLATISLQDETLIVTLPKEKTE